MHATAERPDLDFDFGVTSLRMFSVYGPGQALDNPYQGVLGIFIGKLLRGEPITIFGDGEQTRDFVYIDDIVDGWVRALTNAKAAGGIFNLGSGRSTSINQLAEHAVAAFGHTPGGLRDPPRAGAARRAAHASRPTSAARKPSSAGSRGRPSKQGLAETVRWAETSSRAVQRRPAGGDA